MSRALDKARTGGGPTIIEALTYRLTDHSTADDSTRYRDPAEVSAQWKEEPLIRLRTYLGAQGAWSKDDEEALFAEFDEILDAAVTAFEVSEAPPPEAMFDYLFAEVPADLMEQRAEVMQAYVDDGDGHG